MPDDEGPSGWWNRSRTAPFANRVPFQSNGRIGSVPAKAVVQACSCSGGNPGKWTSFLDSRLGGKDMLGLARLRMVSSFIRLNPSGFFLFWYILAEWGAWLAGLQKRRSRADTSNGPDLRSRSRQGFFIRLNRLTVSTAKPPTRCRGEKSDRTPQIVVVVPGGYSQDSYLF